MKYICCCPDVVVEIASRVSNFPIRLSTDPSLKHFAATVTRKRPLPPRTSQFLLRALVRVSVPGLWGRRLECS